MYFYTYFSEIRRFKGVNREQPKDEIDKKYSKESYQGSVIHSNPNE